MNTATNQENFVKMLSAGAARGMGVMDYRVIFMFENQKALDSFINPGWQASSDADAAVKSSTKGAAHSGTVEVAPGVWVYRITKEGLSLQLTLHT